MNKYIEKIAFKLPRFNSHKERDIIDLVGLGMGAAGLTMGASRTMNTSDTNYSARRKAKLEEESLKALKDMNRTLKKSVAVSGGAGAK
jgi:hypothetical protein